jgi:hypothetical protein
MPGFDGTGPNGQGALSGRQMGNCVGARANFGPMRGMGIGRGQGGMGRGMGRGFRAGAFSNPLPDTDRDSYQTLVARVEQLENKITMMKEHDADSDNQR